MDNNNNNNERHAARELCQAKRYSPEERAARTKGIPLIGKITLKQYELLVSNGYDGDVIKAWTKYRAWKEIAKLVQR